jgi:pimeloyl-ACP methyl ester carboxylesterase
MERPVQFTSDGKQLRGILHTPQAEQRTTGVIFLNAGLVYRAGPHRLYIKTARRLCQEGYPCLRFDFPGVGDSDGEVNDINMDIFSETSHTITALGFFMREVGVQNVTLVGLCSGARNAIWTARKDSRIGSLILLSMPVTFDRSKTPIAWLRSRRNLRNNTLVPRVYQYLKSTYLWKVLLMAWPMFLAFSSGSKRLKQAIRSRAGEVGDIDREELQRSCKGLLAAGRRIFFIYADSDETLIKDFRQNVGGGNRIGHHKSGMPLYDFWVIAGTTHVFPGIGTQQALIDRTVKWLNAGQEGRRPQPGRDPATVAT